MNVQAKLTLIYSICFCLTACTLDSQSSSNLVSGSNQGFSADLNKDIKANTNAAVTLKRSSSKQIVDTIAPTKKSAYEIPREVSRTSGVAPLNVFFTAGFSNSTPTNRDFNELEYSWNFGDASAGNWGTSEKSKNSDKGAVASHLFETPGTYTVNLTVKNDTGVIDTESFTITVSDPDEVFSGIKTTCISAVSNGTFEGCPAGATQITTDDLFDMAKYGGSERRILLQRGSVWKHNASRAIRFPSGKTFQIGAFGNCQSPNSQGICANAPLINMIGKGSLVDFSRRHDWRLMDITLTGSPDTDRAVGGNGNIQDMLILRMKTTGFIHAMTWQTRRDNNTDRTVGNAFISCNMSDAITNIFYGGSEKLSLMGNIIFNSRRGHVVRVFFSYQGVISHNILSGSSYKNKKGLHALKFHGPREETIGTYSETGRRGFRNYSKFTVISHNLFGSSGPWPVSIGAQNGQADERISDITIEDNKVIPTYGTQSLRPITIGIVLGARYVAVRNNMIDGSGITPTYFRGVHIKRRGAEPTPLGIRIYNNTIYRNGASPRVAIGVLIDEGTTDTIVRNNTVSFPEAKKQHLVLDRSKNAIIKNNVLSSKQSSTVPPNNRD